MNSDDEFLRAIAEQRANDFDCGPYAEWLDRRDDPRGEFLRIQSALRHSPGDAAIFRGLCEREQEFIGELDPIWVQQVSRYTTAAPCRNLAQLVPDLVPFARYTTRLHPHRALAPLFVSVSKIGGRFLWPASQEWPACEECGVPLAAILQLRAIDAPDVTFPSGTDLLQLFWCPDEEAHDYVPAVRLWWRNSAAITTPRDDEPDLSEFPRVSDYEGIIPYECRVSPERVLEYPVFDDLYSLAGSEEAGRINQLIENVALSADSDLAERFASETGPSSGASLVFYELSQCPGTKIGGKPALKRGDRHFEHLVTFASWETDAASFRRWLAVEDQRVLSCPGQPLTWERLRQSRRFQPLQEVLGMQLGRTQRAHIFVCRESESWEVYACVND